MKEYKIKQWRKSRMSGMTCIKCDKKISSYDYLPAKERPEKIRKKDLCKCKDPIKVDMNSVDHHMITEMTYLTQKSELNKEKSSEIILQNGFKLFMNKGYKENEIVSRDPQQLLIDNFHEKDGVFTTIPDDPKYEPEIPVLLRTAMDDPTPPIKSDSRGKTLHTLYFGHPLADPPVSEEEIKEYNINLGILDEEKYE